jgi:hypothetical protein
MTSLEWLEREQSKAESIDAERIPVILDQPEHLATILLSMMDGMRALISNCLAVNGTLVILKDQSNT